MIEQTFETQLELHLDILSEATELPDSLIQKVAEVIQRRVNLSKSLKILRRNLESCKPLAHQLVSQINVTDENLDL